MKLIIKLLGILIILIGISLLINSDMLLGLVEDNLENKSMYISAIGIRLVLGVIFILAAKESRYPTVIKFIGYLSIIAAVVFVLIGHDGFIDFLSSLIPALTPLSPVFALIAIAIGGFLIYAFSRINNVKEN